MLISFAALVAILLSFGGFLFSVLKMVRKVEAVFLLKRNEIDPDFFTDLQDRLAELADRGKAYALILGIVCALAMFPLEDLLVGDGGVKMMAMLIMCIKMILLFILWHFICQRVAMKFSKENFAQAKKLIGLRRARGRVVGIHRNPGESSVLTVKIDQDRRLFVLPEEVERKFNWDAVVGSRVVVYFPANFPEVMHIIINPIREEPEHLNDPNLMTSWVPHSGDEWR